MQKAPSGRKSLWALSRSEVSTTPSRWELSSANPFNLLGLTQGCRKHKNVVFNAQIKNFVVPDHPWYRKKERILIMTREIESFITHFVKELEENNAAIFAGAGLSTSAGYVNWKELIRPFATELNLDIDKETDLVGIAQYYLNDNGRQRISQHLLDNISTCREPIENHRLIARLPISTYWTTNYDKLIEQALEGANKIPDVKYTISHLSLTKQKRDAVIYKMHGDIDHPDSAVLTKDDYEKYANERAPYITALSGDLVSKTFLFLGFSFTDPNLDYIMSRVRGYFKEHQRQHYCIFRKCNRTDYASDSEYTQATVKQSLVINDLKRFQVKVLLVEQYSDITEILKKIEKIYRGKSIFLSGSAHEYGEWDQSEVESFLCKLGELLIERNYKISSGIGLGIGNAFITGAIKAVYEKHNGRVNDYLNMQPFPQYIEDENLRKETWKKYRYEIISSAGIALFFMGNKLSDGNVILADGMREEFNIAIELGLFPIPIGCSGYMANVLWEEVSKQLPAYFDTTNKQLVSAFNKLNDKIDKPEQIISYVLEILELIWEERK